MEEKMMRRFLCILCYSLFILLVSGCGVEEQATRQPTVPPEYAETCFDGVQSGDETDIDCGGGCFSPCVLGQACSRNRDCQSGYCDQSTCDREEPNCGSSDLDRLERIRQAMKDFQAVRETIERGLFDIDKVSEELIRLMDSMVGLDSSINDVEEYAGERAFGSTSVRLPNALHGAFYNTMEMAKEKKLIQKSLSDDRPDDFPLSDTWLDSFFENTTGQTLEEYVSELYGSSEDKASILGSPQKVALHSTDAQFHWHEALMMWSIITEVCGTDNELGVVSYPQSYTGSHKLYQPIGGCGPSRLSVGDRALVASRGRTALYSHPVTMAQTYWCDLDARTCRDFEVTLMTEGEGMRIVGGPFCMTYNLMWEVDTDSNHRGWIHETTPFDIVLKPDYGNLE